MTPEQYAAALRYWGPRTHPLPAERESVAFERTFTPTEMTLVRQGVFPDSMDDKWLILYEEPWLRLHRSWTGNCIYALRLEPTADGTEVAEAWVNRQPEQHTGTTAAAAQMLPWLIDKLLLGQAGSL